jgi:hypothetical protein
LWAPRRIAAVSGDLTGQAARLVGLPDAPGSEGGRHTVAPSVAARELEEPMMRWFDRHLGKRR